MIQVHRQDFNGRMITIRAEDVRAIACLFGVTPDRWAPGWTSSGCSSQSDATAVASRSAG